MVVRQSPVTLLPEQETPGVFWRAEAHSWASIAAAARRTAAALTRAGLRRGDRVAYLGENCPQALHAYFGVLGSGGVLVPLHARCSVQELRRMLAVTMPELLICSSAMRPVATRLGVPLLEETNSCPGDWCFSEDDPAAIYFTSGTSGEPTPVTFTHRELYTHLQSLRQVFPLTDESTELLTIPHWHAHGWGRIPLCAAAGALMVIADRWHAAEVLSLIELHHVTELNLVPTMAHDLLGSAGGRVFPTVRRIQIGGAPAPPLMKQRLRSLFPLAHVFEGYGLTEAAGAVLIDGRSIPGVEVRVDGVSNELLVRRSEEWLHTGDLAVVASDGLIRITGRSKDLIITGGENVAPAEIESALSTHPDIQECAAFGMADTRLGEVPAVVVVPRPGIAISSESLMKFAQDRLAPFKVPRRISFRDLPLPRTATGKIARAALVEEHRSE